MNKIYDLLATFQSRFLGHIYLLSHFFRMPLSNILLWPLAFGIILSTTGVMTARNDKVCDPKMTICDFWLELDEKLTMLRSNGQERPADLVCAKNGSLYLCKDSWPSPIISPDDVITTDGKSRLVFTYNASIPGPGLIVYQGQQVSMFYIG